MFDWQKFKAAAAKGVKAVSTRPPRATGRFHVTNYDPKTGEHHVIATYGTVAEAQQHPEGTHIVQTHAYLTKREWEAVRSGEAERAADDPTATIGRRAAGGYLLAGPVGAAFGAYTSKKRESEYWRELPTPRVFPKEKLSEVKLRFE